MLKRIFLFDGVRMRLYVERNGNKISVDSWKRVIILRNSLLTNKTWDHMFFVANVGLEKSKKLP